MLTPVNYSRTQATAPTAETKFHTGAFVAIAKSCQNNANLYTHSDITIYIYIINKKTHQGERRRGLISNNKKRKQNSPQTDRRKLRSQTSDNMDRWKAEQGRGREKRKIRRKKSRRERVRRKKMQMREKVGKSRNTMFFQWFGAPEGRKVGSLKQRVQSQLARWKMKNYTPLWREAHFEVKLHKTHHSRTTFGSWDVEKVHAVVARSTFPSQNLQNTRGSDHFWRLRCRFASLHYTTLHYTPLHYYTPPHHTTFHNTTTTTTPLHSTTLHYTPPH